MNRQKKKQTEARSSHLRAKLNVEDDHVLQSRTLRDHFEHFDERLDEWAENSAYKNIVDDMIGPRSAIVGNAIKDEDIMRLYDPNKNSLVFRGESFDIQVIVDGVLDIKTKTVQRINQIEANKRLQPTRYPRD